MIAIVGIQESPKKSVWSRRMRRDETARASQSRLNKRACLAFAEASFSLTSPRVSLLRIFHGRPKKSHNEALSKTAIFTSSPINCPYGTGPTTGLTRIGSATADDSELCCEFQC